jgi:hypothetical protein
MQGCRRSKLLFVAMLAQLIIGCASSGREQATRSGGPSPSFGLNYVPQQSEPPVESDTDSGKPAARKTASRKSESGKVTQASLEVPADDPSGNKGNKLINWMANRDKEAPRKPLPLSSSSPVASDDEQ